MYIPTAEEPVTTLLYVEDDKLTQELVIQILTMKFPLINILQANNGQEGLDLYARNFPDIVVSDIRMPVIDGIQMAKQIKNINSDAKIIILSAADEVNYFLEAIDIGINNYLVKPIKIDKFITAIQRCLDSINLRVQLQQKEEYVQRMAYFDFLTGLPNRQLLSEFLHKALANAQRHKRLLSVLSLDLDGFKNVNDTLGHTVGDELLKAVAERLRLCCSREQDTLARWGGDEFIILLTDLDSPQEAVCVAQKINKAFEHPFTHHNQDLPIGISIGISFFPEDGTDAESLLKNADLAMYCAKNKGKNQFYPVRSTLLPEVLIQ